VRPAALLQCGSIVLNPAVNGGMVHLQTPFPHPLFPVAIAERIPQVPAYAQQNDLGFKVTPFERVRLVHEKNSSVVLEEKPSLP